MTRVERCFVKIWFVALGLSIIALWVGWIAILLAFLVVTFPIALVIAAAPSVLMYLTAGLFLYAPLRRAFGKTPFARTLIAGVSAAAVLAVGIAIPKIINKQMEAEADALVADDRGQQPLLRPVRSVALLDDNKPFDGIGSCGAHCQRLLFSELTTTVFTGPLDAIDPGSGNATVPLVRHRIVPLGDACDNSELSGVRPSPAEWIRPGKEPYLWDILDYGFAPRGLCFTSDGARDAKPEVIILEQHNFARGPRPYRRYELSRPGMTWSRQIILRRVNDRAAPLMRRTRVKFETLQVPLWFEPPFEFDTRTPGRWARGREGKRGTDPFNDQMMGDLIKDDVRVLGLRPPLSVRAQLQPVEP